MYLKIMLDSQSKRCLHPQASKLQNRCQKVCWRYIPDYC